VLAAERQVVASERRWHAATHVLEQARAALKTADSSESAESYPVLSPIDGRVLRVIQESENVVAQASPLVELGDPGDLEIAVDVLTTDAARIKGGDKVSIERWGAPRICKGSSDASSLPALPKSRRSELRNSASGPSST